MQVYGGKTGEVDEQMAVGCLSRQFKCTEIVDDIRDVPHQHPSVCTARGKLLDRFLTILRQKENASERNLETQRTAYADKPSSNAKLSRGGGHISTK